jgi:hypothetical protein
MNRTSLTLPLFIEVPIPRPSSYGIWIYNYLCNQCLSPLMLWARISIRARCTTLRDKGFQWLATGRWFSSGPYFCMSGWETANIKFTVFGLAQRWLEHHDVPHSRQTHKLLHQRCGLYCCCGIQTNFCWLWYIDKPLISRFLQTINNHFYNMYNVNVWCMAFILKFDVHWIS